MLLLVKMMFLPMQLISTLVTLLKSLLSLMVLAGVMNRITAGVAWACVATRVITKTSVTPRYKAAIMTPTWSTACL